jgi:hypothetical protein
MNKNPAAVGLNKKQQRAVKSLVSGKIVGLSVQSAGSKRSIRFVACCAPFLACNNYDVIDDLDIVHCNNSFPQCKEYLCKGKMSLDRGGVPVILANKAIAKRGNGISQK